MGSRGAERDPWRGAHEEIWLGIKVYTNKTKKLWCFAYRHTYYVCLFLFMLYYKIPIL